MPLFHDSPASTRPPTVTMRPSLAVELEWIMSGASREDFRRDHPALASAYDRHPDLAGRVTALWGPAEAVSCGGFIELMVLAHHGGLLYSVDAEAFLGRLEELCATCTVDAGQLPLVSETPEDRAAILRRLRRLRGSARLRREYARTVRAAWDAVRDDWERHGRPAVQEAMAARRALQSAGADWREVARGDCDFGDLLDRTAAALRPGGEVAVVPAYFTHRGLLIDLPGVVVVGVRVDTIPPDPRARSEELARHLKAIADPTRLAMLTTLRDGPRSVTDLATSFSVSQPTASNHVKVLREAGLIAESRTGARKSLAVRTSAVDNLLAELRDVLAAPATEG